MIEVLDIRDAEPESLDITPQLAAAAYSVMRQYCRQAAGCGDCVFNLGSCVACKCPPMGWPELEVPSEI